MPYIMKPTSVTLFPVGRAPLVVADTHPSFARIKDALRKGDEEEAIRLANIKDHIIAQGGGRVSVTNAGVLLDGHRIENYVAGRLMAMFAAGENITPLANFVANLYQNPSYTAIQELYLFLESANLPITDDGHFLAYKTVTGDFKDKHTRRFDNSPGAVQEMPRGAVDDNRDRTCSDGFHAAAYNYARHNFYSYGDHMVVVKINPADVVSVPSDYNNEKLRTCRYEVLYEVQNVNDDSLTGKLTA
jgi:hypothetical protein